MTSVQEYQFSAFIWILAIGLPRLFIERRSGYLINHLLCSFCMKYPFASAAVTP